MDFFQDYYLDHHSRAQTAVIIPLVIIAVIILSNSFRLRTFLLFEKNSTFINHHPQLPSTYHTSY